MQKPRFVEKPEFHVVGLRERFTPATIPQIPRLWERFVARRAEIRGAIGDTKYGVCWYDPEAPREEGAFFYASSVGVRRGTTPPEGLVAITVPAGRYAVFTHRGPISEIAKTVVAAWREWLPAAGLKPSGAPDFELYDERFRGEEPDSEVDLYIPVAG